MVDIGIWIKNVSIAVKAGLNVNSAAITIAETDKHVLEVESYINVVTGFNWSDAVAAGLNADVQGILELAGSCLCANIAISYDMGGYNSVAEATAMMDFNDDTADRCIRLLKLKHNQEFIENA